MIKKIKDKFLEHPKSLNMTYLSHFICAIKISSMMYVGSIICTVHAIFPFLFKDFATNMCENILKKRNDLDENSAD